MRRQGVVGQALLTTSSGEHFFKSFGMSRILDSIGAENVYRDEE